MSYGEQYEPVAPPEIREPREQFRVVEFYVHLGIARPDLRLIELVHEWLHSNSPVPLGGLSISYHRASQDEPDLLVGVLLVGEPIDVG